MICSIMLATNTPTFISSNEWQYAATFTKILIVCKNKSFETNPRKSVKFEPGKYLKAFLKKQKQGQLTS